jgi:hypothetical protein
VGRTLVTIAVTKGHRVSVWHEPADARARVRPMDRVAGGAARRYGPSREHLRFAARRCGTMVRMELPAFVCSSCGRTDLPPAGDWDPPICQECDAAINFDADLAFEASHAAHEADEADDGGDAD